MHSKFIKPKNRRGLPLARAVFAAVALYSGAASAATEITSYALPDLFIGFRQTGSAQSLVFNLGSATQFLPTSLGGTWNGISTFTVQVGYAPQEGAGVGPAVFSLTDDLSDVFGADWADNATDGSSVRWGIVGLTNPSPTGHNTPINGYRARTAFVSRARTDANTQSSASGTISISSFTTEFNSFVQGSSGTAFINQQSTENSSAAFAGTSSAQDNWATRIGSFGDFGLGLTIEQGASGAFQGPTNSVLDLWILPGSAGGALIGSTRTATGGSFWLTSDGQLQYGVIPEPSSLLLATIAVGALSLRRSRVKREA